MFNKLRKLTGIASVINAILLLQSPPVWAFQYSVSQFPHISENPSGERQPLVIYAASSLKRTLDPILAEYSETNQQPISVVYGGSSFMLKQLEQLAPMDILISANYEQLQKVYSPTSPNGWLCELYPTWKNKLALVKVKRLANRGLTSWSDLHITEENKNQPSNNTGSHVVQSENTTTNISSEDNLSFSVTFDGEINWNELLSTKANLTRMERIVISDPLSSALGFYTEEALINSRHFEAIKDKLFYASNSELINSTLTSGIAEFGIVFLSDAMQNTSYITLGIIPETLHQPIIYSIGTTCLTMQDNMLSNDVALNNQPTNTTQNASTMRTAQRNQLIEYLRSPTTSLKFLDNGFSLHDSKLDNTSILKRFSMLDHVNDTTQIFPQDLSEVESGVANALESTQRIDSSLLSGQQTVNASPDTKSVDSNLGNSTSENGSDVVKPKLVKPKLITELEAAVNKVDNTELKKQTDKKQEQSPESAVDDSTLEIENE